MAASITAYDYAEQQVNAPGDFEWPTFGGMFCQMHLHQLRFMFPCPRHSRHPSRQRRGGAMIEFAICLPLLLTVTMGTVEACRMIYLRQSIKIAAYECARLGIVPGVVFADLQNHCDVLLSGRRLKEFQLSCEPAGLSILDFSDPLIVKVDISVSANALLGSWFYAGTQASETVTIMAEF